MYEDFQLGVRKQLGDRGHIFERERIDYEGAILGGELDKTEFRPIRALPEELGVEGKGACGSDLSGGGLERRRIRDDFYAGNPSSRAMSMRITSDVPSPISRIFESRKCRHTGNSSM